MGFFFKFPISDNEIDEPNDKLNRLHKKRSITKKLKKAEIQKVRFLNKSEYVPL